MKDLKYAAPYQYQWANLSISVRLIEDDELTFDWEAEMFLITSESVGSLASYLALVLIQNRRNGETGEPIHVGGVLNDCVSEIIINIKY